MQGIAGIIKNRRILKKERRVSDSRIILFASMSICLFITHQELIRRLDKTTETEILLDDDIIYSCHYEADLGGVGCAGEMGVDLL